MWEGDPCQVGPLPISSLRICIQVISIGPFTFSDRVRDKTEFLQIGWLKWGMIQANKQMNQWDRYVDKYGTRSFWSVLDDYCEWVKWYPGWSGKQHLMSKIVKEVDWEHSLRGNCWKYVSRCWWVCWWSYWWMQALLCLSRWALQCEYSIQQLFIEWVNYSFVPCPAEVMSVFYCLSDHLSWIY